MFESLDVPVIFSKFLRCFLMENLALAHEKKIYSYLAFIKNTSTIIIFQGGDWQESPKLTVSSAFSNFSGNRLH